uniref:Aminotransferase-like plant mobile domain-containing protein n=1 Tax=Brassica campestris TaxID=3711 RepID=A0A3P6BQ90_BRACM|nr:unnamed protein product [Brassica rapa]
MDSTSSHGNLVEEREELMVLPSENNTRPIIKKSHLLKPHVTTTLDGSEPSPGVKSSPLSVSFSGWRLPNQKFKSWFRKMSALHKPIWIQSGIFQAIKASTHKIRRNPSLILSLSQKWNPETKTFVFPWGEATITLEDVTLLLGFSLLGSSVYTPLESSEIKESVLKLEKRRKESGKQVSWISSFEDDQMEHEAFLAFWLSNFVFPEKQGCSVSKHVFSVAVRLARGERIALAPAVLACLYRDLGKVNALSSSTQNVDVRSLFKLVQVWIWERFKSVGPRPGVIPNGEPRIARWSGLRQGAESVRPFLLDDFDWRPYTQPLRNWNPPRFYNEKAKRVSDEFACCVRSSTLDGFGFTEGYYPNRVALQFGLAQDLTGLATLDGSKQHIPSRLTTASVSAAKYRDWWMRSVKEPAETFNASNTGDDDDDDVPLKVLPLSQVFQKLGDGMKKAEQLTNKKRKQASEDENEIAMDCLPEKHKLASGDEHNSSDPNVDSGAVDEMEEDGNITIAQIIKLTKKCVNVENTEGGEYAYGGVEVDNNVPDLPQKLASGDETVPVPEIKRMSVENDETSPSDPLVASNRIAEKEEEVDVVVVVDDGRLNQRKLGTDEIALQLEARILKVEKTLAKIRQWKMGENQTKTPVSA